MLRIKDKLQEIESLIRDMIRKIEKMNVGENIKGGLQYTKMNNIYRYYLYNGKNNRKYINSENHDLAVRLANRDYYNKLIELLKSDLDSIAKVKKKIKSDYSKLFFSKLHPARKSLIIPIEKSDKELIQEWKSIPYEGPVFPRSYDYLVTKNGEKVRSKSEKILADTFYDLGIVYKYECPLHLDTVTLHPDFTFYDPVKKKEIYWEHFGMMDTPEYSNNFISKMATYQRNGIKWGVDLLMSFESSEKILDIDSVIRTIKENNLA